MHPHATSGETRDELVARFLYNACPDHHVRGRTAHVNAWATTERLLARHPELVRDSLLDGDRVRGSRRGRARARRAAGGRSRKSRPEGVGAAALPVPSRVCPDAASSDNTLAIARALLERGANPNAFFMAGDSHYTPLVGAIGMGEEDRPPHAQAERLARLLLERGAEPYDMQVIYNIVLSRTDIRWVLELLHAHCMRSGRAADWSDPEWKMLDMGDYGTGARWLLGHAIERNDVALAQWLLEHGAGPHSPPPADRRWARETLVESALRGSADEIAALLVQHGATPASPALSGVEEFTAACIRLDVAAATSLATEHPEYLHSPVAMFAAAKRDRADVVALLLSLGSSTDVEDFKRQRPLHVAADAVALAAAARLIESGAEPDPREAQWGATPLGFSVYRQSQPMIDLLSTVSRDIWNLTYSGKVARVRELLAAEPALAAAVHPDGDTPLMRLPNDEATALELTRLWLAHGTDPALRNAAGASAFELAMRRELVEVAAELRAAGG